MTTVALYLIDGKELCRDCIEDYADTGARFRSIRVEPGTRDCAHCHERVGSVARAPASAGAETPQEGT